MTNHETHESSEPTGPVIRIPFLKADIPELDGLPSEEQEAMLEKCRNAPELKALSRRHLLVVRLLWLFLALCLPAISWGGRLGVPEKLRLWLGAFAIVLLILTMILLTLVYHFRSSKALRQLVSQEIQKNSAT